jgi:integrase
MQVIGMQVCALPSQVHLRAGIRPPPRQTGQRSLRFNWRRAVFLPARSRARISPRFRIHDLRHTAASLMIQAGYPPKMLQEIMGHASITTTLDLYGHLYPGDMEPLRRPSRQRGRRG